VFVPQHELQDFLRTAELLEIKGLLKDDAAWPPQGLASLFQAPISPTPPQKHSLPNLPTVPVSSFLLPTSIVSGHITEGTKPKGMAIFQDLDESINHVEPKNWVI
jgi:hypothetical protein